MALRRISPAKSFRDCPWGQPVLFGKYLKNFLLLVRQLSELLLRRRTGCEAYSRLLNSHIWQRNFPMLLLNLSSINLGKVLFQSCINQSITHLQYLPWKTSCPVIDFGYCSFSKRGYIRTSNRGNTPFYK